MDVDAAEQYIRLKTPIDVREEGRIEIIKSSKCQKGKKGCWCFQYTPFQQCYICINFCIQNWTSECFIGVNARINDENDSDDHNEGSGKEITIKVEDGDDDSDENDDDESNEDNSDNHIDQSNAKDDNDGDDDDTDENNDSSIDASVGSRNGKSLNKSKNDRKNESKILIIRCEK